VHKRIVSPDGTAASEQTWTYTPETALSNGQPFATTDPQGNIERSFFTWNLYCPPAPSRIDYTDSSGTLLKQVVNTLGLDGSSYVDPYPGLFVGPFCNNPRITGTTTILPQTNQQSQVTFSYGNFGNIADKYEYDWGAGGPGALLRQTDYQYLHNSNPGVYGDLAAHILDRPTVVTTIGSDGNNRAQSINSYDTTAILSDLGGTPQHDPSYSTSYVGRANLTQVQHWLNTANGFVTTATNTYDDLGNLRQTTDANNNSTSFSYSDNWYANTNCVPAGVNTQAFVTQTTNALSQSSRSFFYPCTGLLGELQDANDIATNRTGTTYIYDAMNRPLEIDYADGGQKTYAYNDNLTNFPMIYVMETTKIGSTNTSTSWAGFDGLGRKARSAKQSGEASPNNVDMSDTCYDSLGRVSVQNYPFQGPGWGQAINCSASTGDSFTYDALGRVTQVAHADNSPVSTDYSQFPVVTVTDEAGRQRRNQTDALGRLLTVWEPDNNAGLSYETDYQYDTLGNLIRVDQKGGDPNSADWRTRTFAYDSLSRLITANNPESGTISYGYDNNGNLISKLSPTPNQTDPSAQILFLFGYDQLNWLIWRWNHSQPSDPVDRFYYDLSSVWGRQIDNPIGRLVLGMSDGGTNGYVATIHSYDVMGRPKFDLEFANRANGALAKPFSYAYNLDGSLNSITYPSGRVLNYKYNSAQRPISAIDSNNINFATAAHYFAFGGLGYVVHGSTSSFGGIVASENYNVRMQPNEIGAGVGNQPLLFDLVYEYCYDNGHNNGNVCQILNQKDSARSQAFAYDYMNRLIFAWTPNLNTGGNHNWGESFGYDPWGNLLQKNTMGSDNPPDTSLNVAVNGNNQVTSWCYDAAGNILDPDHLCPSTPPTSFPNVYDGQNRLTASTVGTSTTSYDYDADGERVRKTGSTGTLYWRGPGGEVLEETDLNGNLTNEYIFFGGKRIARYNPTNGYSYYFSDHLGSSNVVTDALGNIKEQSDFYPFGGERIVTDLGLDNRYKFTGKERDPETGCDYFGARYYCNPTGRFITPDWAAKPIAVPYANFGNPQSLNLYSYVQNNPTTEGDADGHGDYYTSSGKRLGSDGIADGYVHVAIGPVEKAPDGTISVAGTHTMFDISPAVGQAILDSVDRSNSPSGTDTTGGFHEEGFSASRDVIQVAPAGAGFQPTASEASVRLTTNDNTTLEEHVHPAGTTDSHTIGGTQFDQNPSPVDRNNASQNPNRVHVVAGAGDKQVRFFNGNGVQATTPLDAFSKAIQEKKRKVIRPQFEEQGESSN
jgi:RHS repeat-associated protein